MEKKKKIKAKMYKGMTAPIVEIPNQELAGLQGGITVSLESIETDLQNQSFLMLEDGTGCMSNPSGPRC